MHFTLPHALTFGFAFLLVATSVSSASRGAMGTGSEQVMERQAPGPFLDELVRQADLVFQGPVTGIDYRVSGKRSEEDVQLPHTFVTFKIERVLKGRMEKDAITLRFLGGPTGKTGQYLMVEDVPAFDVGEKGILFVAQNTAAACPLVGCSAGRFRIIDQKIYTDEGQQVLTTGHGTLTFGGYAPTEEVATHELPSTAQPPEEPREITEDFLKRLPQDLRERLPENAADWLREQLKTGPVLRIRGQEPPEDSASVGQEPGASRPLTVDEFAGLITSIAEQQRVVPQAQREAPVVSANPDQDFYLPAPRAAPPSTGVGGATMTEQDRQEIELLERHQGNPVIRQGQ
jgi:hypothetical protein